MSPPIWACREGICQHHSVGPWHIYGFSNGSLIPITAALAPLPCFPSAWKPNKIFWVPLTEESMPRPCAIPWPLSLFQNIEGPSVCHSNNHLAVVLHISYYSRGATHSLISRLIDIFQGSPMGQSLTHNHKHASPMSGLLELASLTPSWGQAPWPISNLLFF